MKNNTLIVITIAYLILSILFNYGFYQLLIVNELNVQYFLIFIYFLSEVFAFLLFLFPKTKDKIINNTLGAIIINDESMDISMISATDNNLSNNLSNNITNNMSTSLNISESKMSIMQPFVGMKCISFLVPSVFDFFSKFFIFNGLRMIGNEIVLRSIIQLCMILILSKVFLKSKYNNFSIIGVLIVLIGLIISCIYYHIIQNIKLYFSFERNDFFGMILCILGEILGTIQIFFQMKYFKIGEKYCYREIAWEGVFGLIISFIFFEASLLINCSKDENENNEKIYQIFLYCYKEDSSFSGIELLLNNIKNNIVWTIIFFLISMFYSLIGAILAKYIGEVYRVSVDAGRISIILQLILIIHTDNINVLNVIFSVLFTLIILFGIILSIFLRKQKGFTFEQVPFDKSFSQDLSLMVDENSNNLNESNI